MWDNNYGDATRGIKGIARQLKNATEDGLKFDESKGIYIDENVGQMVVHLMDLRSEIDDILKDYPIPADENDFRVSSDRFYKKPASTDSDKQKPLYPLSNPDKSRIIASKSYFNLEKIVGERPNQ